MVMVALKLAVVLFVIVAGLFDIKASTYSPFIPPAGSKPARQERPVPAAGPRLLIRLVRRHRHLQVRHRGDRRRGDEEPQRDMPIGILGSLGICSALQVGVSLVVTGMVKYTDIKSTHPAT